MVASYTQPNSAFIGWVCEGYQDSSTCTQFSKSYPQDLTTVAVSSGQLSSPEFDINDGVTICFFLGRGGDSNGVSYGLLSMWPSVTETPILKHKIHN